VAETERRQCAKRGLISTRLVKTMFLKCERDGCRPPGYSNIGDEYGGPRRQGYRQDLVDRGSVRDGVRTSYPAAHSVREKLA